MPVHCKRYKFERSQTQLDSSWQLRCALTRGYLQQLKQGPLGHSAIDSKHVVSRGTDGTDLSHPPLIRPCEACPVGRGPGFKSQRLDRDRLVFGFPKFCTWGPASNLAGGMHY